MTRLMIAVLAAILAISPARADDDFEGRRAVAAEYVALYLETADLSDMSLKAMQPLLVQIAANQPDLWREKGPTLTGIAVGAFARLLHESLSSIDAALAEAFTLQELEALRDFYSSPEGQSVMRKMPDFMRQTMPGALQQAMSGIPEVMAALEAEGVKVE